MLKPILNVSDSHFRSRKKELNAQEQEILLRKAEVRIGHKPI
jgi:hypothetical protein